MKKIFHLLYDLGRGGAENLLVQTLPHLDEYDNYIITFSPRNDFGNAIPNARIICLNTPHIWQMPIAAAKLSWIIRRLRPSLVHSQLTNPNIIARIATPKSIPLITAIQNSVKHNIEFQRWYIRLFEKLSLRLRSSHVIFVSESVKHDYFTFLNISPQAYSIIHNFVDITRFSELRRRSGADTFKIVSVGSLSYQKNFSFLINAFLKANIPKAVLHIYGEGPDRAMLEELVAKGNYTVKLMGNATNIENVLPDYDLYVSSSLYEGFSLSVLEAMAVGLPLLVTDIPSFREQCGDFGLYFKVDDMEDFAFKLHLAKTSANLLETNASGSSKRVYEHFTLQTYLRKLTVLYKTMIDSSADKEQR